MNGRAAAEFFAGIGLVRMALERCGWGVQFANDIDPNKFEMYRDNFGDDHFFLGDVHKLQPGKFPDVSLATASFPCIDLSLAGNRKGLEGNHSAAYWGFHALIRKAGSRRPPKIILENVAGLISSKDGSDLRAIIVSLNKLGYACDLLLVDAACFVPQSRQRLFIIGSLDTSPRKLSEVPAHACRSGQITNFILQNPDLKWSCSKLPSLPTKKRNLNDVMERFEENAPEWWSMERQGHLYSQMSPLHKKVLRYLIGRDQITFATVYKRVRPAGCRAELRADGIAGCLRTPRGGSSKQFVVQAGFGEWRIRNMTAREYARLQGVPDSFKINVPYNQALFGFGDAVCVPAVEWVIKNAFCLS